MRAAAGGEWRPWVATCEIKSTSSTCFELSCLAVRRNRVTFDVKVHSIISDLLRFFGCTLPTNHLLLLISGTAMRTMEYCPSLLSWPGPESLSASALLRLGCLETLHEHTSAGCTVMNNSCTIYFDKFTVFYSSDGRRKDVFGCCWLSFICMNTTLQKRQ